MAVPRQAAETLNDTTSSIGKGISKSLRSQSIGACSFIHELKDCMDPEDFLKSLSRLGKEDNHKTSQNIIHKPIDWSNRTRVPSQLDPRELERRRASCNIPIQDNTEVTSDDDIDNPGISVPAINRRRGTAPDIRMRTPR